MTNHDIINHFTLNNIFGTDVTTLFLLKQRGKGVKTVLPQTLLKSINQGKKSSFFEPENLGTMNTMLTELINLLNTFHYIINAQLSLHFGRNGFWAVSYETPRGRVGIFCASV